ncbi:ArsR/SmtB family transcription factor [Microbacterium sp. B2969]|uniref:ArsR/SmtB family transcription factor n=1 Tax=Microbacterium alkaliflavum TaxID=3248839 RepID=A0ABW7QCP6_9MICO
MTTALAESAPLFAALGDPMRLGIVLTLGEGGPLTSARLAAERPVTRQAVEKHLAILADAGLVRSERRGRERWWSVEAQAVGSAGSALQQASRRWDAALERLRAHVEDPPDRT